MKKIIILLAVIIMNEAVPAQVNPKRITEAGISSTVSFYNYTYRGSIFPHITITRQHQNLSLGPLFLIATNIGLNISSVPKLTGIKASYRTTLPTQSKRFEFYLGNDLLIQLIVDKWDANIFNESTSRFQDFKYRNAEFLLENYVGYGFKMQIGKNWYLSKGVGVGFYISMLNGDELSEGAPEIEFFDYRGYGDFGFSWNIQLGFGMHL